MCHLSETTVATNDEVAYNETNTEATTADSGRTYYLKNSHGDVIGQMDEQGNLLASFAYNAFGELVSAVTFQPEQKEAFNRFFYAGEQYDETSGLYYLRARQYDVSAGRFTQEDTYLGDGRNLYAYVHSNPLKYVDPTGHFAVTSREDNNYLDDLAEKRNDAGGGGNTSSGLNFSGAAATHMGESGRYVPMQILQDGITYGTATADPQGSNATMYYSNMYKNGTQYNLEVLYNTDTNTIYHYMYYR